MTTPRVAVVYDVGGSPLEIARGIENIAELVFVVQDSTHTRTVRGLLEQIAPVVYLSSIEETARELATLDIDAILTYSEHTLGVTTVLGEVLGLRTHSAATVEALTDKSVQRDRLREHGVDQLWSVSIDSRADLTAVADTTGFPFIIKPRVGGASRAVAQIDDATDLASYLDALADKSDEPLHIEELLPGRDNAPYGDLISVETATLDGETRLIAITGNFRLVAPFRETGHLWPAQVTDVERFVALDGALRTIEALDIANGITHTEFKLTADGPRLIEVNGRLGGFTNEMCASDPNADLFAVAALIALGAEPWDALPRTFAPYTFVFMQEPPLDARVVRNIEAGRRTTRMANRYKTLHSPPSRLRTDLGTEWLDAFLSVAPDASTMFDRLSDHVASTHFEFEVADGAIMTMRGSQLPSAEALPLRGAEVSR